MLFALTAFVSAFLLFLVQPLMGRYVLPWFGGGSTVWTICMLFFQTGLLGGYAYAHLIALKLPLRRAAALHGALVALSLLSLPLAPDAPEPGMSPTGGILLVLAFSVGAPYVVLSATAPLIQAWAASAERGRSPYRLYAWSNTGSLLALLAYPLALEPFIGLSNQGWGWSAIYVAFAALIGVCAWRVRRDGVPLPVESEGGAAPPPIGDRVLWVALTAIASALLLAVTDRLTEDISASPFLWVLPLGLYLTTFILCFGNPRLGRRLVWFLLLIPAGAGVWWAVHEGADLGMLGQLGIYNAALFIGCMALHGEVVRLRPAPAYLTGFYLATALGGALGGVLVGLLAPAALPIRIELQLTALATGAVCAVQGWRAWRRVEFRSGPAWLWLAAPALIITLGVGFGYDIHERVQGCTAIDRGFYGVLRVKTLPDHFPGGPGRKLVHGRIMHGQQYTDARAAEPLSYYARRSGVGTWFEWAESRPPMVIAAVGLGVGTLATYGRPGDRVDFYEIDPLVLDFARRYFTYLSGSEAEVNVILGDGRLQLARAMTRYDAIFLDAFSSDAIPAHLLTREAFQIYLDRMPPDGMLIINIANRHLDLRPVIKAHVDALGLYTAEITTAGSWMDATAHSRWVFVSRDAAFIDHIIVEDLHSERMATAIPITWTDDFAPLLPLMKAFH